MAEEMDGAGASSTRLVPGLSSSRVLMISRGRWRLRVPRDCRTDFPWIRLCTQSEGGKGTRYPNDVDIG